jgi:hypothetical protein
MLRPPVTLRSSTNVAFLDGPARPDEHDVLQPGQTDESASLFEHWRAASTSAWPPAYFR